MVITKQAIPRRTILRGLGTALALPWLDAMVPALTALAKTPATPAPRFSITYAGNGVAPGFFEPAVEGAAYELTPILQPLAPYRHRALVLSGIDNPIAEALEGEPRGGHGRIPAAFMSGVHCKPTVGGDFRAGTSIDQIFAAHYGHETQLASLELTTESPEFGGSCDTGFACVYTNTLAWKGPTTPLPMQNNPRIVFERLFGDGGSTDVAVRLARLKARASVLDSVLEKTAALNGRLGADDRSKLDDYLQSVRETERRIQKAEEQSDRELPVVEQPAGVPDTFEEHAKMMFDLQVLAFQADLTRVSTFMLARELSGRAFPKIGVSEGFHALSHHSDNAEKIQQLAKINVHLMGLFVDFLDRLHNTQDGDGSLLDHAILLYGSGLGNANLHEPKRLPLIVAGGGGGQIRGGRHVRFPSGTILSNLHVALLHKLGVPVSSVGDSTGPLADI
ncbi:MAG: DUF1552 domain-containing protein [Vicinamibacterales bacterium]